MADRLTKTGWLDHGLKVLAASGFGGLKAEPLAAALGVSRGSFYWHFHDIAEFHAQLLGRWRTRTTDWVIKDLEQGASGSKRLQRLMRMALSSDDRLERAVRAWASHSAGIADAVAGVDQARIQYLTRLLHLAGVPADRAPARAAFLYWAYLGRLMVSGDDARTLAVADIDAIAMLLES